MTDNRPIVGVGAVAVESGRILLIERGNDPGRGLIAVPGGKVRHGETLRDALKREVAEETGLIVEVGDVVWVGEHVDPDRHLVLIDFEVHVTGGALQAGDDAADVFWTPLEEVRGLALTPTMFDLLETLGV